MSQYKSKITPLSIPLLVARVISPSEREKREVKEREMKEKLRKRTGEERKEGKREKKFKKKKKCICSYISIYPSGHTEQWFLDK